MPVPRAVLEHRRRRAAVTVDDYFRRMSRREAMSLQDEIWAILRKRAKECGESCLTASVFRV
jgi:hypothetical protein